MGAQEARGGGGGSSGIILRAPKDFSTLITRHTSKIEALKTINTPIKSCSGIDLSIIG